MHWNNATALLDSEDFTIQLCAFWTDAIVHRRCKLDLHCHPFDPRLLLGVERRFGMCTNDFGSRDTPCPVNTDGVNLIRDASRNDHRPYSFSDTLSEDVGQSRRHCIRHAFELVIGSRVDEADSISVDRTKESTVYPMITDFPSAFSNL